MSFALYPDPPVKALSVPPAATVVSTFVERSARVAELDPPYAQAMFLRVAMLGGTAAPALMVAAGAGEPVEVSVDTQGVFRSPGAMDYVGDVWLKRLSPNAFEIVVGLVSVDAALGWRLGIRNTDAVDRFFTWVVADNAADTAQAWVDPGPADYRVTATLSVGATPYRVAFDPDRQTAYLIGPRSMSVLDLPGRAVVDTVDLVYPTLPIAVDPVAHTVYLSNPQASTILAIDPSTRAVTRIDIPPSGVLGLAVDPARRTLYAWGHDLRAGAGMCAVLMIDADDHTVTQTVSVGQFDAGDLAVEPTTHAVYATGVEPNALLVFDPDSRAVTPITVDKSPHHVAVDPISRAAYLSCPNDNALILVDPATQAATTITVGQMPSGLVVDAAVFTVYVANRADNTVTAIDTRTGAQAVIPAGQGTQDVTVDPVKHTVVTAHTAAGTASVIERRR